jgi:hypothetical protein
MPIRYLLSDDGAVIDIEELQTLRAATALFDNH